MSFGKPHSWPSPSNTVPKYKDAKYPRIFEVSEMTGENKCEACLKRAYFTIKYAPRKDSTHLVSVWLCQAHERMARVGEWTQVFKDIVSKIRSGK